MTWHWLLLLVLPSTGTVLVLLFEGLPWDILYHLFTRLLLDSVPFNWKILLPHKRENISTRVTHNILDLIVVNSINTAPSLHSSTIDRGSKLVDCLFVGDCLGN
jgi:hypothetical protein